MEKLKTIYSKDRSEWRSWLQKNHSSEKDVWLIYYKKHTKKKSIYYDDAVEEAICFGWIDGVMKRIDEERYMQRYSPRTEKSKWSELNVERAKKMISVGLMTETGLIVYQKGIKNKDKVPSSKNFRVPLDFKKALEKNPTALDNFNNFPPSAQLSYSYWVGTAKKEETRKRRIIKSIEKLEQNKKYGEK